MSLVARCVVCDQRLPNQYSGGPACGGVRCARYEATEDERLTVRERDPLPNDFNRSKAA